ncbi:MAG: ribbon-helix-helix domain-containing protein [Ignisphaera sp.]
MPKKRFGVSIEATLYSKIDEIAKSLNINRSDFVEEALKNYVRDLNHFVVNHNCCGLIVVEEPENIEIERILSLNKEVVVNYSHYHINNRCIYTIIVQGNSADLAKFYSSISKVKSVNRRYIPLHA